MFQWRTIYQLRMASVYIMLALRVVINLSPLAIYGKLSERSHGLSGMLLIFLLLATVAELGVVST